MPIALELRKTEMKKIIFRADGGVKTGFGHIYRLLALAEMLREDFLCVFVTSVQNDFLQSEIQKCCSLLILPDSENPVDPNADLPFDLEPFLTGTEIVVIDGYHFRCAYQMAVKNAGCKLVCVDDLVIPEICADLIINHSPGIRLEDYTVYKSVQLCLGLEYAILRKPFFRPFLIKRDKYQSAFVSFGGADPFGFCYKLASIILNLQLYRSVHVLCSSSFSSDLLQRLTVLEASSNDQLILHLNLGAAEIVDLMDVCTDAFVSASTVLLEAYSRGLRCYTGYYVDNQKNNYSGFVENKLAIGMGRVNDLSDSDFKGLFHKDQSVQLCPAPLGSVGNIKNAFKTLC